MESDLAEKTVLLIMVEQKGNELPHDVYDHIAAVNVGEFGTFGIGQITQYPGHSDDMVSMAVSKKDIGDVTVGYTALLKLPGDAYSSRSIRKKDFPVFPDRKTGVVTFGNTGVSGSKNNKLHAYIIE